MVILIRSQGELLCLCLSAPGQGRSTSPCLSPSPPMRQPGVAPQPPARTSNVFCPWRAGGCEELLQILQQQHQHFWCRCGISGITFLWGKVSASSRCDPGHVSTGTWRRSCRGVQHLCLAASSVAPPSGHCAADMEQGVLILAPVSNVIQFLVASHKRLNGQQA